MNFAAPFSAEMVSGVYTDRRRRGRRLAFGGTDHPLYPANGLSETLQVECSPSSERCIDPARNTAGAQLVASSWSTSHRSGSQARQRLDLLFRLGGATATRTGRSEPQSSVEAFRLAR